VRTIGRLWSDATSAGRGTPAYLIEREDGWHEVSWDEAATAVEELANGLLALGIRKGDAFGILAQTSLEWALFDYALGRIGAVGAAIYANSAPHDCRYVLEHSDAVGVLVEDEQQRAKVADLGLQHLISYAELDELRARGRAFAAESPRALAEAEARVGEDDLFTFIYTSGTTGPPKACMIRHRNYYEMATCIDRVPEFAIADDTMLLYLPLAHNFGRLMHLLGAHAGYTTAFVSDPLRVAEAMPAVRPTLLPSVPRLYEKVHTAVLAQFGGEVNDFDPEAPLTDTVIQRSREATASLGYRGDTVMNSLGDIMCCAFGCMIARKLGSDTAARVSAGARDVLAAGGPRTPGGRRALQSFDASLREQGNQLNPGTTADLVTATVFVALVEGML